MERLKRWTEFCINICIRLYYTDCVVELKIRLYYFFKYTTFSQNNSSNLFSLAKFYSLFLVFPNKYNVPVYNS